MIISCSCIDNNNVEFQNIMEMQRIDLLNEFSRIIAVLTERADVIWPNNCYCKPQVYSTLVNLTAYTDCLPDYFCLIANLSRWLQYSNRIKVIKHDNDQSTYSCSRNYTTTNTDNSSNNNYNKNSNNISNNNFTITPELIEELYDLESGLGTPSSSNTF
ncbi:unnamed protein product [Schistosoma turkestanicum]|nr:unnamed protein product [Schistosoma turkestanicum]